MSKRLILILALAFVVGITAYAYAEVQNIKVGGQITVQGIARQNMRLNKTEDDQSGYMTTTKVNIVADLTDNVLARVLMCNERDWAGTSGGSHGSSSGHGTFDIWLSYVTLKELLDSPLTLTIGKQVLRLGNRFVLSDSSTNIVGTGWVAFRDLSLSGGSFDAIKAVLDYDPLTLTLMTAKLDENNVAMTDDGDLYAVNAAYAFEGALAEAYLVTKYQRSDNTVLAEDKVYTWGLRGAGDVNDNLNLQGEIAFQTGDYYPAFGAPAMDREALGLQLIGTYKFDTTYSPMLSLGYTYLSGDSDPTTGDWEAWDPMFEAQTPASIMNAIFQHSGSHIINVKGSMKPTDDITLNLNYAHARLDEKLTNVPGYPSIDLSGGLNSFAPNYTMTDKEDLGDEIDLEVVYDYTEDVKFSLLGGFFFPGDAFASTNDKTASQVIGKMQVNF